jgi:N-acetylglucosamine-6-phosphate deacetylase
MHAITARRYDTLRPVRLQIEGSCIAAITPDADDPSLPLVAPGLVDLQINGYGGIEFNDPELSLDKVRRVALAFDRFGVTRFLATCTTDSFDVLHHSFATIARAIHELPEVGRRVAGIHMEGPYISPEDGPRGAHPKRHVRKPDWGEFCRLQEAADGKIKLLTLSPEYDGAAEFITKVARTGVLVAIGHTQAGTEQIKAAVDAGARMSTHLGNGAHPLIRRHPNYIWDQLAEDRLVASLITDGHHLPPAVVKSMVRAKTPARCVLVSDITMMGGMPPGRYTTGLGELEVLENGKLVPAGQPGILAGASQPLSLCVANAMRFAELDLATAVEMASVGPAKLIADCRLQIADWGLNAHAAADLMLFRLPTTDFGPLDVVATINGGDVVYGRV